MNYEIVNAQIGSATIRFDQGAFLSLWLSLDYGGSGQGFGGYVLGGDPSRDIPASRHAEQTNLAAEWIAGIMSALEVESWSDVAGRYVRVKREKGFNGKVIAIGHPIKDRWFTPDEGPALLAMKGRTEESA